MYLENKENAKNSRINTFSCVLTSFLPSGVYSTGVEGNAKSIHGKFIADFGIWDISEETEWQSQQQVTM